MSQLHNIPVRTLRYYDAVGLFRPAKVNDITGYRYYTIEQFELLNSIRFLRHMGFSIKDIRNHMENRGLESFRSSLEEYKRINDLEIRRLKAVSLSLDGRIRELERAGASDPPCGVEIRKQPDRRILYLKKTITGTAELELNLRELENRAGTESSLLIGRVGVTVSEENLRTGLFHEYNSIFILRDGGRRNRYDSVLKAGEYASVSVNAGDHEQSPLCYEAIFRFIGERGYEICGDSIERVIVDSFISDKPEEYLTEIEVPVRPAGL